MKRLALACAAAACAALCAVSVRADEGEKPIKPLEWLNLTPAKRIGGRMTSSGYLRGKVVMVDCRDYSKAASIDALKELQSIWDAYKSKPFVLIGSHRGGDVETVKRRIEELKITFPVYHEAALAADEPGSGWKGDFVYIMGITGRNLFYDTSLRRARMTIGSAIISSRVHNKPGNFAHYLRWELAVLPGLALNTYADFKAAFPKESLVFAEEAAALEKNEDVMKLAKLEKICRQARDYDSETRKGAKPLTAERIDLVIDHYSYLKTNVDERVSQEAKNCLADLKWLQVTLPKE